MESRRPRKDEDGESHNHWLGIRKPNIVIGNLKSVPFLTESM